MHKQLIFWYFAGGFGGIQIIFDNQGAKYVMYMQMRSTKQYFTRKVSTFTHSVSQFGLSAAGPAYYASQHLQQCDILKKSFYQFSVLNIHQSPFKDSNEVVHTYSWQRVIKRESKTDSYSKGPTLFGLSCILCHNF